jgi:hypothetical protein
MRVLVAAITNAVLASYCATKRGSEASVPETAPAYSQSGMKLPRFISDIAHTPSSSVFGHS